VAVQRRLLQVGLMKLLACDEAGAGANDDRRSREITDEMLMRCSTYEKKWACSQLIRDNICQARPCGTTLIHRGRKHRLEAALAFHRHERMNGLTRRQRSARWQYLTHRRLGPDHSGGVDGPT
jgi:hypothetical protein